MTTVPSQPPDGRTMIETIGHELVADASAPQRDEIWTAIQQNADGVKRIASQIRGNPRVLKPIPLLLSKLRAGAHLAPSREQGAKLSLLDLAHRLYLATLADLDRHSVLVSDDEKPNAWAPGWTVDDAIAYAIDAACPGDHDTEAALRARAGLEPYVVADRPPPEALAALTRLAAAAKLGPRAPAAPRKPEEEQTLDDDTGEDPPPDTLAA